MTLRSKNLRKGDAKIQLIACRDRVNELANAGHGPVSIFQILTKEKLISMSYGGFYEAYRYGAIRRQRRKSAHQLIRVTPQLPPPTTQERRALPPPAAGPELAELNQTMEVAVVSRSRRGKKTDAEGKPLIREEVL